MHFKDFTDHFYQYPHHFTYSQILQNHKKSFVSFDKKFDDNLKNTENKRRFNGKILKNIFTQLKNKTSTELEEFIDLDAAAPQTSGFSKTPRYETYNLNGVFLSKSTGDVEKRDGTITNPEVRISVDSQEFEHIEKSIRFVVCPKKRLGYVSGDDKERKLEFNLKPQTSSILKTKIGPEVQEGRVFEVYNVLKKAISNVKWKYKKCRNSRPTNNSAGTSTANNIERNKPIDDHTEPKHTYCKCEKLNTRKIEADCNCWNKEDETLICLLKLETRENYKQIKHIEQELKLQRKALKFLNNRCKSLENIVMTEEKKLSRNNSDTGVQEIYVKASEQSNKNSLDKEELNTTTNFEEDEVPTTMNNSEDTEEELSKNTRIDNEQQYEETNKNVDNEIKETRDEDVKINSTQKIVQPELVLKNQSTSNIKIMISRSRVVINATDEELTNGKKVVTNNLKKLEESAVKKNNHDRISCHCIQDPTTINCICPSKKSSFVLKLFRKQSCDPKCKCCTTTKVNKKKCRYFIEKKNKDKFKPSNEVAQS
ncbi:uncharacterized protein LOC130901137 isoform X1 [Diorhabda carinulata]|uniref:uncharacterized protein LOC130901137 isoform X1 n=1 Tax=Diorhabda carinulata TaxID=1163345 RepID=UPI0025A03A35|nr:uncharacterized protein LOC130901137 isoform X1 [Diorhabda carinulata]